MPTNIRVRESTANIPSARRVVDIDRTVHYLYPNANPLVLLSKRANKRSVSNSEFKWIEKTLATVQVTVSGSQTSGDTSIEMSTGHGNYVFVHDLLLNTRTNEMSRVTGMSTDTATVVRAVGSTAAAAMNNADTLLVISSAYAEGGALGQERSVAETYPLNYTQINRWPFGTTGTEEASENYTGKDRPRLRKESAREHMLAIERSFIHGQRNQDTSSDTGKPIRYTGGFRYFVTTNVTDFGAVTTEPEIETFCESIFRPTAAGETRVFFAASGVMSVLNQIAAGRLQTVPTTETYGIKVKEWLTAHGTLLLVKHRLLDDGFAGYGLAVDPTNVGYASLRTRDTKLRIDVGTPGDDGWTDDYLTECGFEVIHETAHGVAKGIVA